MFGAVDVGLEQSWWDFGMLSLYRKNSLLLTEDSQDAKLLRRFFGVNEAKRVSADCSGDADIDATSVVSAMSAKSGKILNSAVHNVTCDEINADGAVLVGCAAKKI